MVHASSSKVQFPVSSRLPNDLITSHTISAADVIATICKTPLLIRMYLPMSAARKVFTAVTEDASSAVTVTMAPAAVPLDVKSAIGDKSITQAPAET